MSDDTEYRRPPGNKTDRVMPAAPVIADEIVVEHFKKNRGGDTVKVVLRSWEGHNIIDIRTWTPDGGGKRKPGKGFSCGVKLLPEIAKAVAKAESAARDLGLLDKPKDGE